MRGLLLYKRHQMLKYPTIDPLIRDGNQNSQPNNQFSKLKSGKIIRRLDTGIYLSRSVLNSNACSPYLYKLYMIAEGRQACRTWDIQDQANALYVQSKPLGKFQILGEIVYITEPLAYLSALKVCGHRSWKPWVLALGLDVTRWVSFSFEARIQRDLTIIFFSVKCFHTKKRTTASLTNGKPKN